MGDAGVATARLRVTSGDVDDERRPGRAVSHAGPIGGGARRTRRRPRAGRRSTRTALPRRWRSAPGRRTAARPAHPGRRQTSHSWITTSRAMTDEHRREESRALLPGCPHHTSMPVATEIGAALLDHDARQPPRRRPRQREAFARGERPLVAGAGRATSSLGRWTTARERCVQHLRERVDASRPRRAPGCTGHRR